MKLNEMKLGLFCSLQSNSRAKFISTQSPSRQLITCEAQKEMSDRPLCTGTAGAGAVGEQH